MKRYEAKARDYYGEVVINKALMSKAGFGARAVPVYVGEWDRQPVHGRRCAN